MRRLRRWGAVSLVLGAIAPAGASATVELPFVARYSTNDPGAIWVTGSTLMTCPAAAANCAASQAGTATGAALNNNGFAMQPVDVDGDATTFSSSSSTFTPTGLQDVLFAGLYFGGRVTAGTGGGAPAPNAAARGTALLQTPTSGGYVPVSGAVADSTVIPGAYTGFADVTALVRAGGRGSYTVANVQSGTGLDRFAGWSLVVVYRDPALPLRNLTVFDGLAAIQQGDPPLSIGVSGFKTPLGGPVRSSVGIVGYEGDRGSAGDRLALNGQLLTDAANPATNVFNSSVSFEGTNTIAQRLPPFVNQLGFDADRIRADGVLANGATIATLEASTTLDQYLIQVVTLTTDLSTPLLAIDKSVADVNGGEVRPGDVLRYTLAPRNDGDDAATAVRVQDAVPAGTTLVPGSLRGPGGAAAPDGRSVGFDVGTLAPGTNATLSFDVSVESDAPDGRLITNAASVSGVGATAGEPVDAVSPQVTANVRRPPFQATLSVEPKRPVAGEPATASVTTVNRLSRAVENVRTTTSLSNADVLSATGGDCSAGEAVRCRLGTLEPGERVTVRIRLRPLDRGALRAKVTIRGTGVATQRLTLGPVRVRPGRAQLTITKRAGASVARRGRSVAYRIVVTAARRAATAHGVRVCDTPGVGLRLRSASRGGVLRGGRACWRIAKLAPGARRTLRVIARVMARSGTVRNAARARGANVRRGASLLSIARVRVARTAPSPSFTG